jgi:hypothetical protein
MRHLWLSTQKLVAAVQSTTHRRAFRALHWRNERTLALKVSMLSIARRQQRRLQGGFPPRYTRHVALALQFFPTQIPKHKMLAMITCMILRRVPQMPASILPAQS